MTEKETNEEDVVEETNEGEVVEETNEKNVTEDKPNSVDNGLPFTDVQLVGGIILALLVVVGGLIMFGGGAGYGSAEDFNYPDWADENGLIIDNETNSTNTQAAIQSHTGALTSSSYTITIDGKNQPEDGETEENTLTYKYNSESQTAFGSQEFENNRTETYDRYSEQEQLTAQYIGTDNETYDRRPLLQQSSYTAASEFVELLTALDLEAIGTTDNGDTVVYNITGVNTDVAGELPIEASGEIMLHSSGYFTKMDITLDNNAQNTTTQQTITISDVGSTSVEQPDWYDTAIEQTDEVNASDIEVQQPPTQQPPTNETSP